MQLAKMANHGLRLLQSGSDCRFHSTGNGSVSPGSVIPHGGGPASNMSCANSACRSGRPVPGLCKAATLAEIEAQGWSLNAGRYVGAAPGEAIDDVDLTSPHRVVRAEF